MKKHFKTGKAVKDSRLESKRYLQLLANHILPNTKLAKNLAALQKKHADNSGNRNKGPGKAKTKVENLDNDALMEQLVVSHGPVDGKPGKKFWLRLKAASVKPKSGTKSCCGGDEEFPGNHFVFEALAKDGIRQRLDAIDAPTRRARRKPSSRHHILRLVWSWSDARETRIIASKWAQRGRSMVFFNSIFKGELVPSPPPGPTS
ncbi:expressed unknown protein [Seminavis robusta]|uniref:Uncharacterized protein n=1 Tax=Seminavis robusta TaxID=568900 RepID=A0A9N8DM30_9STRA|nr:expressed unknown protein [Seminavis robusta]|eukprot:Sro200_g084900.1 n/a (204) ;mRNA; r:82128-82739